MKRGVLNENIGPEACSALGWDKRYHIEAMEKMDDFFREFQNCYEYLHVMSHIETVEYTILDDNCESDNEADPNDVCKSFHFLYLFFKMNFVI